MLSNKKGEDADNVHLVEIESIKTNIDRETKTQAALDEEMKELQKTIVERKRETQRISGSSKGN